MAKVSRIEQVAIEEVYVDKVSHIVCINDNNFIIECEGEGIKLTFNLTRKGLTEFIQKCEEQLQETKMFSAMEKVARKLKS